MRTALLLALTTTALLGGPALAQQPIATLRSAVVVLVDETQTRMALEDELVELARGHRYDAISSHTIVPDLADLSDEEVLSTLAGGGVRTVLMLRPASIGQGSSLESVRASISPSLFANMHAFADAVSPSGSDDLIAVIHMAIYALNETGAELVSSGAVWLDETVESREQGIERLENLILANVDAVRPAIREHFGLPPLPAEE